MESNCDFIKDEFLQINLCSSHLSEGPVDVPVIRSIAILNAHLHLLVSTTTADCTLLASQWEALCVLRLIESVHDK